MSTKSNAVKRENVAETPKADANDTSQGKPKVASRKDEVLGKMTAEQRKKLDSLSTWSGKFRYMKGLGYSIGDIAAATGKIYQHVRNVLKTPVATPKEKI